MTDLSVTLSEQTIKDWLDKDFVSDKLRSEIGDVDILIVPRKGYGEFDKWLFPQGTEELLDYLNTNIPDDFQIDICTDDENYMELELRSDSVTWPTLVIQLAVVPVMVNLLSSYITHRIRSRVSKTDVRAKIVIEDESGSKSVQIDYEGSAVDFDKVVGSTLRLIDSPKSLDVLRQSADQDFEERLARLRAISDVDSKNE